MRRKLLIITLILYVLVIKNLFAIEIDNLVIVIKDSIPLRMEPNNQSQIAKYAVVSLQLKVLEVSKDKEWYKVKIGEDKGYQLRHTERYWVFNEDVYKKPESCYSNIKLDVSVLENNNLRNAQRIDHKDYLYKLKTLKLDTAYYVGSTYSSKSPGLSCSPPLSVCARIYKPGSYFIYEKMVKSTDASDFEELKDRYRQLYENGTTTPFYEIESDLKIKTISEKLISAKIIMAKPGCYAENYVGTELDILNDQIHPVNSNHFLSPYPIKTEYLFQTKLEGGVQYVNLLYILKVKYINGKEEMIVRRIFLGWPKCM